MILGTNLVEKRNEIDPGPPSDCLPIQSHPSELGGFWTLIAIGGDYSNGGNESVHERENEVPGCDLSHEFIKGVSCSVGIALRRPEISALDLLPIRLVLIYPPVAHVALTPSGNRPSKASIIALRRRGVADQGNQPSTPSTVAAPLVLLAGATGARIVSSILGFAPRRTNSVL